MRATKIEAYPKIRVRFGLLKEPYHINAVAANKAI